MSSDSPQKHAQREDRIPFSTQLRFEADQTNHVIVGLTKDVSMSGAFIETMQETAGLTEGDEGVVFVEMSEEGKSFEVSFHCVIARIIPNRGIGLNFESEEEDEESDEEDDEES
ncbi:MAG: PilZ domain-containing protein [Magnetococcales bacterium]|nr:PilZ domain-containing protein [Magnetococcales bacterium]